MKPRRIIYLTPIPSWIVAITIVALAIFMIVSVGVAVSDHRNYVSKSTKFYSEAEACRFADDDFFGVAIPPEADVYFITNVSTLDRTGKYEGTDYISYGKYIDKKIEVLFYNSSSWTQEIILHEVAHHRYAYNLTQDQIDSIKKYYSRFCKGPDEFYAYSVENECKIARFD